MRRREYHCVFFCVMIKITLYRESGQSMKHALV